MTTPSPMMEGDQEVGGLTYEPRKHPYVLRFTPFSQGEDPYIVYEMKEILEEFIQANDFDIYVLCEEIKPKLHYHLYLETDLLHKQLKKKVQEFVYPYYPNRARGFGTAQYSCLESLRPLQGIIYNFKQAGENHWSGFNEEFVNQCRLLSFEKKKNDFAIEIEEASVSFLASTEDPYSFAERLSIIYSIHDKPLNFVSLQSFVNSKIIKRDPKMARSMINKNLCF